MSGRWCPRSTELLAQDGVLRALLGQDVAHRALGGTVGLCHGVPAGALAVDGQAAAEQRQDRRPRRVRHLARRWRRCAPPRPREMSLACPPPHLARPGANRRAGAGQGGRSGALAAARAPARTGGGAGSRGWRSRTAEAPAPRGRTGCRPAGRGGAASPRLVDALEEEGDVTPSAPAMSQRRDALTRFIPVSYFWICWNLIPTFSASCCCVVPFIHRR